MLRTSRFRRFPISPGNSPLILFISKRQDLNFSSSVNPLGRIPVIWLKARLRVAKCFRFARLSGRLPFRLFIIKEMPTTWPSLISTPCHRSTGALRSQLNFHFFPLVLLYSSTRASFSFWGTCPKRGEVTQNWPRRRNHMTDRTMVRGLHKEFTYKVRVKLSIQQT